MRSGCFQPVIEFRFGPTENQENIVVLSFQTTNSHSFYLFFRLVFVVLGEQATKRQFGAIQGQWEKIANVVIHNEDWKFGISFPCASSKLVLFIFLNN